MDGQPPARKRPRTPKRVRFVSGTKTHDGLRAATRNFEQVLLASCMSHIKIQPNEFVLYLHQRNELPSLGRVRVLCDEAIRRVMLLWGCCTRTATVGQPAPKRKGVPMLVAGGGQGYCFQPADIGPLLACRAMLAEVQLLLFARHEETARRQAAEGSRSSVAPDLRAAEQPKEVVGQPRGGAPPLAKSVSSPQCVWDIPPNVPPTLSL